MPRAGKPEHRKPGKQVLFEFFAGTKSVGKVSSADLPDAPPCSVI